MTASHLRKAVLLFVFQCLLSMSAAAQGVSECDLKHQTIKAGEMMCFDFKNAQACALLEQERRAAAAMGCSGAGGQMAMPPAMGGGGGVIGSGVIGDPSQFSRDRVYDDQCVRKTPRNDLERAQCEQLYRSIHGGRSGGSSAPGAHPRFGVQCDGEIACPGCPPCPGRR